MGLVLIDKEEASRLAELESVIKKDMKGFIRVGMALQEIKDRRLYRGKYTTWEEYIKGEWDLSKAYANRQIQAYEVVQNLEGCNLDIDEKVAHGQPFDEDENNSDENGANWRHFDEDKNSTFEIILPKNEAQVRPLTLLPPQEQPEAWKKAVIMSDGKVTALAVTKVVESILEKRRDEEIQGVQKAITKEVSVPEDFSEQFSRLTEILSMHRKNRWKNFNRKKALEYVRAIESYLKSNPVH